MTRSTSLFLLLALVVSLNLQSQGAEKCIQLTNFCDTIEFDTSGSFAYGGWDWLCYGNWTNDSMLGNAKKSPDLATHMVYEMWFTPDYATEFLFKKGQIFDLWGTNGQDLYSFSSNQPFTITNGACRFDGVDFSKPRLMSRRNKTKVAAEKTASRCLHFTNFCDTITLNNSDNLLYGNWDWQCTGDYTTTSIIGNTAPPAQLTTRPGYPGSPYGYPFGYTTQFSFRIGKLFDLYETSGVQGGVFKVRNQQPYTVSNGACSGRNVDTKKGRMIER